jgi:hypothetical protein
MTDHVVQIGIGEYSSLKTEIAELKAENDMLKGTRLKYSNELQAQAIEKMLTSELIKVLPTDSLETIVAIIERYAQQLRGE